MVGTNGVSNFDLHTATVGTHSGHWSIDDVEWQPRRLHLRHLDGRLHHS
ncbi:hypothetical protein [Kitasatospora sp. NPDC059571]